MGIVFQRAWRLQKEHAFSLPEGTGNQDKIPWRSSWADTKKQDCNSSGTARKNQWSPQSLWRGARKNDTGGRTVACICCKNQKNIGTDYEVNTNDEATRARYYREAYAITGSRLVLTTLTPEALLDSFQCGHRCCFTVWNECLPAPTKCDSPGPLGKKKVDSPGRTLTMPPICLSSL